MVVYEGQVTQAIGALKKPWALDSAGVCVAALRLVPELADPLSHSVF